MAVNVKLLRKVRRLIAAEPRRLRMKVWGMLTKDKNAPPCGTVACLAGWTILASKPKSEWKQLFKLAGNRKGSQFAFAVNLDKNVDGHAAELLGIPKHECPFYNMEWKAKDVLRWLSQQIAKAK